MTESAKIIPMPRNASATEKAVIVGEQPVSAHEADYVAAAAQRRLRVAARTGPFLARLRARFNRLDARIREEVYELRVARRRVREADLRPFTPQFSPTAYWIGVGLTIIGELAIAKASLDFLEQPEPESWAMAVSLGVLVFASAKSTAKIVRQHFWCHGRWPETSLAIVANGALAFLFWHVAQLRTLLSGSEATGWANLAIQTALYVAMVFWSMLQVNPSYEGEQLAHRIRKLERRLDGPHGLRNLRRALADRHNEALARSEIQIRSVEEDAAQRIYQYRAANDRFRTEGESPSWFRRPIAANIFEPLQLGRPVDIHPRTSEEVDAWNPPVE